jgi:hypothetical protein
LTNGGFDNIHWGANEHGICAAAVVDWMHGMLQGLGKDLMSFTGSVLKKAGVLNEVNNIVKQLNRRTSVPTLTMKKLSSGITSTSLLDATDVPGSYFNYDVSGAGA